MPNNRVAIVGDSQSVNPGGAAARVLKSKGYEVTRVSNIGMGPYDYVRISGLWNEYINCVKQSKPDLVVLIFGSNDAPNKHLEDALVRMKNAVKPKVILTGPPLYPDPDHQVLGAKIKAVYQKAFGEDYFDSYPYTPTSLTRDSLRLHLTVKAAQPWGNAIAAEVERRIQAMVPSP